MSRREFLLTAIQATEPGAVWTTRRAARVLAGSPWGCHPNTARKDLRAFVRRGFLIADDTGPRRTYIRSLDSLEES